MGAQHHSIFSHRIISPDRKGRKKENERSSRSATEGKSAVAFPDVRSILFQPSERLIYMPETFPPFRPSISPPASCPGVFRLRLQTISQLALFCLCLPKYGLGIRVPLQHHLLITEVDSIFCHLCLLFAVVALQNDDLLRRLVEVAREPLSLADEHRDLALQVLLPVVDHVDLQRVGKALNCEVALWDVLS